ncbi:hypothetical protein C8F01DRAFT_320032 [Mycena amicta]|nr:hypothetical protein C8F01DRAFT_320032 [Mycena amicta]
MDRGLAQAAWTLNSVLAPCHSSTRTPVIMPGVSQRPCHTLDAVNGGDAIQRVLSPGVAVHLTSDCRPSAPNVTGDSPSSAHTRRPSPSAAHRRLGEESHHFPENQVILRPTHLKPPSYASLADHTGILRHSSPTSRGNGRIVQLASPRSGQRP